MTAAPPKETWEAIGHHFIQHPVAWALIFALFLSPLLIHELGHWMALHWLRIPVVETGLGFGPRLFRIGDFSVRWLLVGAYVLPDAKAFLAAKPESRLGVAVAGPVANFVYSTLLLLVVAVRPGIPGDIGLLALSGLSALLGVLNLIPVPPFDGWVILESFLAILGFPLSESASSRARRLGSGLLYGLAALFILWLVRPSPVLDAIF